jgi:hypothetical protein
VTSKFELCYAVTPWMARKRQQTISILMLMMIDFHSKKISSWFDIAFDYVSVFSHIENTRCHGVSKNNERKLIKNQYSIRISNTQLLPLRVEHFEAREIWNSICEAARSMSFLIGLCVNDRDLKAAFSILYMFSILMTSLFDLNTHSSDSKKPKHCTDSTYYRYSHKFRSHNNNMTD